MGNLPLFIVIEKSDFLPRPFLNLNCFQGIILFTKFQIQIHSIPVIQVLV